MILIVLTYVAGILTILSPCILPVLPFVFSKSQGSFTRNGLPLLAGMGLTFSLFSAIAVIGGEWIGHANQIGRVLAMILMTLFGLSLVFPHLAETALTPLTRLGSRLGSRSRSGGRGGPFLIGISTGLLWAPCAGPILGLVLTGAAAQGNTATSVVLLFSYSLGAATSLALALVAGNRFLGKLKKFLGVDQIVKRVLGCAVLIGVIAIAFNLDRTVLTRISKVETASFENKLLALAGLQKVEDPSSETLDVEGQSPDLSLATPWLNSKPISADDLKGKVVLVDFWTYSCINCLRTLPYLKAWSEKYKNDGLVVIGIHAPEFAFEKSIENVEKAVKELGITYPVGVDNDYKVWNLFHNRFWPAHYFVDRQGRIRHHHFGEGEYTQSEDVIRRLLTEGGTSLSVRDAAIGASGVQAPPADKKSLSPETYIGYGRSKNFVFIPSVQHDQKVEYRLVKDLALNQWSLEGKWLVEEERAVSQADHAQISFRFQARDLHLVLGSGEKTVKFQIKIDGHEPGLDHGVDVDAQGLGKIDSHRLYQLIRLQGEGTGREHIFTIEFFAPEVEAYAFTFG